MAAGAFNQVQSSLRWFVDNFSTIADWRATLLRVANFRRALINERCPTAEPAPGRTHDEDACGLGFPIPSLAGSGAAPDIRFLLGWRRESQSLGARPLHHQSRRPTMIWWRWAARGFGIMALIVAVERGWVTTQSRGQRGWPACWTVLAAPPVITALSRIFCMARRGTTIPFGRKDDGGDLVETSFLMMGLLTARQYFDDAAEAACAAASPRCGKRWNGTGMRKRRDVLIWHWSPNNGFALNHPIRGWNETLITYVLAAGAPRYADRRRSL